MVVHRSSVYRAALIPLLLLPILERGVQARFRFHGLEYLHEEPHLWFLVCALCCSTWTYPMRRRRAR